MSKFNKGDAVKILPDSKFVGDIKIPEVLIGTKLFVKEVKDEETCTLAKTVTSNRSVGTISMDNLVGFEEIVEAFDSYIVLTTNEVSTLSSPAPNAKTKETLYAGRLFTVIGERNGYGRLKNDRGWVNLAEVTKLN